MNIQNSLAYRLLRDYVTYVIFVAVTIFFAVAAPNFATLATVGAILRITAIVSVIAIGMTFVIISAEIDLSVGSVASFSGMILALLLDAGVPSWLGAIITLLMGAAIGACNGLLVTRLKIPSFLVTLGMLSIFSGAALTVTNTMPVPIVEDGINNVLWNGSLLGIAAPVWWTLLVVVAGFYLLHVSLFGRRVLAVGGNALAANFSGINVNRTKVLAFVLSGSTAALAGMMLAARSTAGNPSLGSGLELDVIAAVIIGGTSLFGGYGTIIGSVIGAIFIGIIGFGLLVMGFSTSVQEIIKGAIIILAVSVNRR
ncbi:ABC transporter permease [Acidisoma cladoniae]|jgi:ribose transport system permease protein|uniref:ABC transporter permease n=1 Tax=Acidisoma cladoniae TaxID=3040935 RepID=UPI00254C2761|nr:ABC transporter permease [Acidisoma sp. PAMC 29798]